MFNRDRWNELLEVLTSNWLRTILTAFGVFWGIYILILLLAAGKGLENGVKADFGGVATNTIFMWARTATKSYKGMPKGRRISYRLDDVRDIWEEVPNLRYVSPRNQLGGFRGANNVVRGLNSGAYNVYGDYPEIINQEPMDIMEGRFINFGDIEKKAKIAIIGLSVKMELYEKGEDVIGTYIKINGVNFMVVGVYKKDAGGGDNEENQNQIFIPFSTFSQAFNRGDRVGWMVITAEDEVPITSIKESIFNVVKTNHKIHPDDRRAVGHSDLFEDFNRVETLFTALKIIAYFVGILVLLSGVIGVSNIMLIVVKERTKEIGIRRAIGATPGIIRSQVLGESVFLTILSGMAGIVFGAITIYLINYVIDQTGPVDMFLNPSVDLRVISIALIILIGSGIIAGLIPAQNAIRVKPVEALRNE